MPRQLPWLNKGSGSSAQVKHPPKPVKKRSVASDINDDFFDGTVLASSSKGKGRAVPDEVASDDDLPDLPTEPSTSHRNSTTNNGVHKKRAPSSSPPPMADLEQPQIESMDKGLSKFDLRDDEWMMVEDEFLETAKLFTRHLHIAEYERLKERIEEKKKEAEVARPVVADAKLSVEGAMKEKAKVQEKKQRKAIRDVFASQDDEDEDADNNRASMGPPPRAVTSFLSGSRRAPPNTSKSTSNSYAARDSDSDDLDAPQRPVKLTPAPRATATTAPAPIRHTAATLKSASSSLANTNATASFAKPAPPLPTAKPRSRISRATPFDMLDDYTPRKTHTSPKPAPNQRASLSSEKSPQSPSPAKHSTALDSVKSGKGARSVDLFDDWGPGKKHASSSVSKGSTDQHTKRKSQREKEDNDEEKRRKLVKLDDIPTFLF
ncbi:uncharacterized protein K460DRAFT_371095 [Cucurbitaria berberidis CBS 394.84]|uniref:Uncharacterized protein n=1 Tax=Cucurbitaria berberidis CBS 394.84 TaxID=1168544 RepID=A0A9P4G9D4_9PLEO|nr:uncharacterized protein K460DRAFT_371095 [Cucurbitaria berberidis CBS 394.84]KAF1841105.1 hypothetical protein K460DRAFT_371095 [Cucurbitaria berberidis CBS 394.84]